MRKPISFTIIEKYFKFSKYLNKQSYDWAKRNKGNILGIKDYIIFIGQIILESSAISALLVILYFEKFSKLVTFGLIVCLLDYIIKSYIIETILKLFKKEK